MGFMSSLSSCCHCRKAHSSLYEGGKWGSIAFAWAGTKLACFGWCLHGFGQWRGMVVGGYRGADVAVRGAVGGSEMGRHYGEVGQAYLVVIWHWEQAMMGC